MLLKYKKMFEMVNSPKIGDMVVCLGNIDGVDTRNHIGYLKKDGIQFLNRFSEDLHDLNGGIKNNNGLYLDNFNSVKIFDDNKVGNNMPLVYSKKFKDIILYDLKFLLDYQFIYFSDVSFIDVTERSDTISCLSARDSGRLEPGEDPWTSTMRQNIRIGRFFKKIIDDDVEEYINQYKFSYKLKKDNFGRFEIAIGVEMPRWYLEMNYADGHGSLNQSCMRHFRSQKRLTIYHDNPEKIRLLYLLNPYGKLIGRSLLWKLDIPERIFMDRIYYTEDYVEKLFKDYAKRKGYLTKDEVEKNNMTLRVYLDKDYGPPKINPYMDTFKFFVKNDKYLTNRFLNFKAGDYWEYVDHD